MSRPDHVFRHVLARGREAELWVTRFLTDRALPVTLMPLRCRPDGADPDDYTDGGDDLLVFGTVRVQVKRRSLRFSGLHDFPFATIFIDAEDARFHDADWFVLTNTDLTAALVVDVVMTRHEWIREQKFDSIRRVTRTFISCPVAACCTLDDMVTTLLFSR